MKTYQLHVAMNIGTSLGGVGDVSNILKTHISEKLAAPAIVFIVCVAYSPEALRSRRPSRSGVEWVTNPSMSPFWRLISAWKGAAL